MQLGAFSISLAVKDLAASRKFYEALGFVASGGDPAQNWLILRNDTTVIGLFHGMFERNTLTFNPGWRLAAHGPEPLRVFADVRELQQQLQRAGLELKMRADAGNGPAHCVVVDPDGNPVLIDQHVPAAAPVEASDLFGQLLARSGALVGTYKLWLDPAEPASESVSTATVGVELENRVLRIDYSWSSSGKPHQGLLLVTRDRTGAGCTAAWIDTFHQAPFMHCVGEIGRDALRVTGQYADGQGGPPWSWRTELTPTAGGVTLRQFNIAPDGAEAPAVEVAWTRPSH